MGAMGVTRWVGLTGLPTTGAKPAKDGFFGRIPALWIMPKTSLSLFWICCFYPEELRVVRDSPLPDDFIVLKDF